MSDLTDSLHNQASKFSLEANDRYSVSMRDANTIVLEGREAANKISQLQAEIEHMRELLRRASSWVPQPIRTGNKRGTPPVDRSNGLHDEIVAALGDSNDKPGSGI